MTLPGLKDLLPDHLFYDSSRSRIPPPPSSILQHPPPPEPLYTSVPPGYHVQHPQASSDPLMITRQPPQLPPSASRAPQRPGLDARQASVDRSRNMHSSAFHYEDSSVTSSARDDHSIGSENEIEIDPGHQMEADERAKKHACPTCGKRFNRPSSLRIHINTHTGNKPYVCPHPGCSRSFNVSSNMRRHYRNHANRGLQPVVFPIEAFAHTQAWTARPQFAHAPAQRRSYEQRIFLEDQPPTYLVGDVRNEQANESGINAIRSEDVDELGRVPWPAPVHSFAPAPESQVQEQYSNPCPPTSSATTSNRSHYPASLPPQQIAPHGYVMQGTYTGYVYPMAGHSEVREFEVPHGYKHRRPSGSFPRIMPFQPQASDPSYYASISQPFVDTFYEEYRHGAHYAVPPTPPYTNEVPVPSLPARFDISASAPALPESLSSGAHAMSYGRNGRYENEQVHSASASASSGIDAGASQDHSTDGSAEEDSGYIPISRYADLLLGGESVSSSNAEGAKAYGTDVEKRIEPRQQPSPDTPSLHVSALHGDHEVTRLSLAEHGVENGGEKASVAKEDERHEDIGSRRRRSDPRSSLRITSIIHPNEEKEQRPHHPRPESQSRCTQIDTTTRSPSAQPPTPPSLTDPLRDEDTAEKSAPSSETDSFAKTKVRVVGMTPGAAPPPPYPLYRRPSSIVPEEKEDRAEPNVSGGSKGGRKSKRRRRR